MSVRGDGGAGRADLRGGVGLSTGVDRLPVIALSGHLGAGKTTVTNHLLSRQGARLGVVVNDFGEINVDAALVTGQIDEAAAISGGCLCCLPDSGGLDDALEKLAQPRLRLDAILVEASGVADPIALARLIRYSGVERVRLGGVIEVVDAVHHSTTIDTGPEPPERYRAATLVAVTKLDLVAPAERRSVLDRIRERVVRVNPTAHVVVASHGRLDPDLVFDVAVEEEPGDELPLAALLREERHEHAGHEHAGSVSVLADGPVSPTALLDLLEHPPEDAYRIKGRVAVLGPRGPRGYLVNLVGRLIHVARLAAPPSPAGELVAIGQHLDLTAARARLDAVIAATASQPDAIGLRRLQRYRRLSD